jgi:hypothetical protein
VFQHFAGSDASGQYQAAGIPVGPVRVAAADSANVLSVGFADGAVSLPGPATVDVTLGGSVRMGVYDLIGSDGYLYKVGCTGEMASGGPVNQSLSSGYYGAFLLTPEFQCMSIAKLDQNARQVTMGPSFTNTGLAVTRKLFVAGAGKFARYLEQLSNPSATPVTIDLVVTSDAGFDQIVVDPATNGGTYAVARYSPPRCCYPALGFVMAGPAPRVSPVTIYFPSGLFKYTWL